MWRDHLAPRIAGGLTSYRETRPGIGAADSSDEGRGRTALVTGASSGIGWAMCELLAAKGYNIVPVARREARLKELADLVETKFGVEVWPLPADLGQPDAVNLIADGLADRGISIDLLVNNAGSTLHGIYTDYTWDEQISFARIMGLTPARLCHRLLPHMVEQRWGRIINVTSVAALMTGSPLMAFYSASKAFLQKLTEGLASEYGSSGVNCTAVIVGPTDTELVRNPHVWQYVERDPFMQATMMRPLSVARRAYADNAKGKVVSVPGVGTKIFAFALVHTPPKVRWTISQFSAQMTELENGHHPEGTVV